MLPELERHHDVLAPTLLGHAGGPPLEGVVSDALVADAVERAMDDAGFQTAHIAGNSLGGYFALQLAARGRAESVVALAPAGGWAAGDDSFRDTLAHFLTMQEQVRMAAPHAEALLASPEGRRLATQNTTTNFEHIPVELLAPPDARCPGLRGRAAGRIRAARGLQPRCGEGHLPGADRLGHGGQAPALALDRSALPQRLAPARRRVELEGIGHCPQLDVPLETAQLIVGFTAR